MTTSPRQGDVYVTAPSPLTGVRELNVVVTSDDYNARGLATVLLAEIETGARYRAGAFTTETTYGVVLSGRLKWEVVDDIGEHFGEVTGEQRRQIAAQITEITVADW